MNSSISTRKKILAYLADARTQGVPVSGAALASALGISRNAVWKAIHTLQEEGYDIQSIQSKGYILSSSTDILSEELIREDLSASGIPENQLLLQVLDSVDSTNNYCRTLDYGNPATAVLADRQTGGRGRYGRTFESPKGTGIYLTYSFRPYFPLSQVTHVTSIAAVLTHRVLEKISGEKLGIKWVNDIYKGNLKICGILTEGLGSLESGNFERVIVGIGINCLKDSFPPELAGKAGSLTESEHPSFTRNQISAALIAELHRALNEQSHLDTSRYLEEYRKNCFIIGRNVTVSETGKEPYTAYVEGVDPEFRLQVKTPEEHRLLSGGEVSLKL